MSEENTTQETTEATETTQPTMDLDSTIKVDGQEISVRELINTRDEATRLREYNENAKKLIAPSGVDDEGREQAVRYLMSQEGYSVEDINEYVNWTKDMKTDMSQQSNEPPQEPYNEYPETPEIPQTDEFAAQRYQEEMMMREQEQTRLHNIETRQQKIGAEMMRKEMTTALDTTVINNEKILKLMDMNSEDSSRQGVLKGEVEAVMMEGLRKRRASGENYNSAWFAEEASKAADLVYDKFRSVIGDPDRIQRSPETATDSDSLFNTPPVEPPKYEKGDSMGDINVKTREWTLDTLLRGAREDATGGESKA